MSAVTAARWEKSLLAQSLQRGALAKRTRPSTGPYARAVLRDTHEVHQVVAHEQGQHLRDQVVEHLGVVAAKVAERVVVEPHPAAQPPIGGVQLGQALDLPSAVLAVAGGVHPQAEQELGVDGRRSGVRVACIDASVELREVQAVDHRGDGTHGVVVRYLRVQIDAPPAELLTMGLSKSGAAFRI